MNGAEMQTCRCPACLSDGTAFVARDRRGKYYLRCRWCGTTCFYPTPQALTSVLLLTPHIGALLRAQNTTPQELQAQVVARLAAGAGGGS